MSDRAAALLDGGVAVVTGGAGRVAGLGRGMVQVLADAGMRVAILDLDGAAAESVAAELSAKGVATLACRADVRDRASLDAAAAAVAERFGTCNVLCAHVGGGALGAFDSFSIDDWREAFETMVIGTLNTVHAFLPLLQQAVGLRRVVLTASAAALAPGQLQGPYRAAKSAVMSIGETIDLELGPRGIGATVVFPSGMLSPDLLAFAREMDLSAMDAASLELRVAAEMCPDSRDLATGAAAAEHVAEAIANGEPYVITHGTTVMDTYRARHEQLLAAFERTQVRRGYRSC